MLKRGKLFVVGIASIVWFLATIIFLLCILSTTVRYDEMSEGKRPERNIALGYNNSQNLRSLPLPFHPDIEDVFSYEKYNIGLVKLHRLNSMLKKMLDIHSRPKDNYYGFNVTRSEEISVTRDVPDNRPAECKNRKFNYSSLPTVSVITPLHNEALTSLLRHVHAILARTPPRLLLDIILVDDNSTFTYLGEDLQEYFRILDSRIKIIRNKERKGLILSRLIGADIAQGEVIIFLDAHMEVCEGWIEPMLERINKEAAIVVQSDIASIDALTLNLLTEYTVTFRGGFGWDMRYAWFPLPDYLHQMPRTDWDPVPVPVLQGACIAIRKSYFNSVGRFDSGLEIWGGEHFELSFNVWMTGGRIEAVPCAKIGHIFKSNHYSFGSGNKNYIVAKNDLRVAEVWMDGYKKIVQQAMLNWQNPLPVFTKADMESIEERRKMRKRRGSKSFDWYLKSVMPEQRIPTDTDLLYGEILNFMTRQCFYVMKDGFIGATRKCETFVIIPENTFAFDEYGSLKYEGKCVDVDKATLLLKIQECPYNVRNVTHSYWSINGAHLVMHGEFGTLCATQAISGFQLHHGSEVVQLQICDKTKQEQNWAFMYRLKHN